MVVSELIEALRHCNQTSKVVIEIKGRFVDDERFLTINHAGQFVEDASPDDCNEHQGMEDDAGQPMLSNSVVIEV